MCANVAGARRRADSLHDIDLVVAEGLLLDAPHGATDLAGPRRNNDRYLRLGGGTTHVVMVSFLSKLTVGINGWLRYALSRIQRSNWASTDIMGCRSNTPKTVIAAFSRRRLKATI